MWRHCNEDDNRAYEWPSVKYVQAGTHYSLYQPILLVIEANLWWFPGYDQTVIHCIFGYDVICNSDECVLLVTLLCLKLWWYETKDWMRHITYLELRLRLSYDKLTLNKIPGISIIYKYNTQCRFINLETIPKLWHLTKYIMVMALHNMILCLILAVMISRPVSQRHTKLHCE